MPCIQGYYRDATMTATACVRCPAGYKCPTPYAKEACTTGAASDNEYSLAGSLNCYPIPSGMKAHGNAAKPIWCENDEVSKLG